MALSLLLCLFQIRRLKEHVLVQLPPKRRQIIRLVLKKSDIANAMASTRVSSCDALSLDASGTDAESTVVDIPDKTEGNGIPDPVR